MKKKTEGPGRDKDRNLIRQQWRGMSPAEKGRYVISYYGTAILLVVLGAAIALFLVRDIRKQKIEDAFYVMVIGGNLTGSAAETMEQELAEALGLEPEVQQCRIEAGYSGEANLQSEATVSAYMRSGKVDLVIAPEEIFNRYAGTGYLSALQDCGLEELEEQYTEEELFYAETIDYSEGGAVTEIPFRPHEKTADSRCYGICLGDGVLQDHVAGVMANSPHRERIKTGIQYFLNIGRMP